MVAQLIGPDIALWNMSLFGKPAYDGKATPWHQDGEYWPIRPLATCSVWIAIDDSTIENGCLQVIPGSHSSRSLARHRHNPRDDLTLHEELVGSEFNQTDATNIILERGQISLHDVYLMHGSQPNRSGQTRRGMTMRMMPTTSHYDRNIANEMHVARSKKCNTKINFAENPVLLLRGTDRCGKNKFDDLAA
jgi:ectoine hydroxylase-related dioxygenase (phytanoyl-CoA dioxygenase family)